MASFISGDQPVASFDYVKPEEFPQGGAQSLQVAGQTLAVAQATDAFIGSWDALVLPAVGSYPVYGVVTVKGRTQRALVDTLVVVDPADQWHNTVTARLEWEGGPEDDTTMHRLLVTSREQIEQYAPALPEGAAVPERYRAGQLMQARNTYNASISNGGDPMDLGGGIVITPRPLDWAVKQLVRPAKALKAVG